MKEMTQDERLDYLLNYFLNESDSYKDMKVPNNRKAKEVAIRSLMNVRMPKALPEEVQEVQDAYLQEKIRENGIVTLSEIPVIRDGLSIWQGDITRLAVDAIVNAANSELLGCFVPMHTCIDNCIHTFAGTQLRLDCFEKMTDLREKYGEAYVQPTAVPLLTDAYNLPAKKVIHIVGPIVGERLTSDHVEALKVCYVNALDLCKENKLKSLAFCCLSTGVFNFPQEEAAKIAIKTVDNRLKENPGVMERVIFNVFLDQDKKYYEEYIQ